MLFLKKTVLLNSDMCVGAFVCVCVCVVHLCKNFKFAFQDGNLAL